MEEKNQDHTIDWLNPTEEDLEALQLWETDLVVASFCELFFNNEIEQLSSFRYCLSFQQLKSLRDLLKEKKDFPQQKKLTIHDLKQFYEKGFWFIPKEFVFRYILHSEKTLKSNECFLWFVENKQIDQTMLAYFDQLTPEQCVILFQHIDTWWEKVEKSDPSAELFEFLQKVKIGIQHFECHENKDIAKIFCYLLFICKTYFWNQYNSFVSSLGVLLSKNDIFLDSQLQQILKYYSGLHSSPKKRPLDQVDQTPPPAPKKATRKN